MRTQKRKHKITSKNFFLPATKLRLSSCSTRPVNCQTSRIPHCSLNLTSRVSIPPWHKIYVLIICRPCHKPLRAEPARWWRAAQRCLCSPSPRTCFVLLVREIMQMVYGGYLCSWCNDMFCGWMHDRLCTLRWMEQRP